MSFIGEPLFLGKMEQKYSAIAEDSGAYIIGACGFGIVWPLSYTCIHFGLVCRLINWWSNYFKCILDSIPADYGAAYLQQNFDGGDVNSIECFTNIGSDNSPVSTLNYGTYHSGVLMFHRIRELLPLKRQLSQDFHPPKPDYKLPFRYAWF